MDPDLMFVVGLSVGVFSIPSIFGAISDGRVPRAASIAVLVSGVLLVMAIQKKSGGYTLNEIPDLFVSVVAKYLM